MGCTLAEAQSRMSKEEFLLWLADYQLEPWGETRDDMRATALAFTVAAVNGGKPKFANMQDLVNPWAKGLEAPPKMPTRAELIEKVMAFNASLGKR
jgi:hypothetical protein